MKYVRSPIPYMGNKFKLLDYLIPLFPKQINTFYDMFGGSGVVSGNVEQAKHIIYNELNPNIFNLVKLFTKTNYKDVIAQIDSYVAKYDLPIQSTDARRNLSQEDMDKAKEKYLAIRDDYNKSRERDVVMLYTLVMYSFSNLIRFNADNEFNMPVGNQYWSTFWKDCIKSFYLSNEDKDITLVNGSCFDLFNRKFEDDDFIYVDPPYTNSEAVYNEKRAFGGWEVEDDLKLFEQLDNLTAQGIKFGLSNVYSIKGKTNQHLIDWVEKNGYTCIHLDFNYYALGRGDANNDEVFICNYKPKTVIKQDLWGDD